MAFVLIVDDNVETCKVMSRLLHTKGHTIICAANRREALTALDVVPDLVLLDMEMPKMDGIGFLESAHELMGRRCRRSCLSVASRMNRALRGRSSWA